MARNRRVSNRQQSQVPCRKDYIWNGTECVFAFQSMDCPEGYDECGICGGDNTRCLDECGIINGDGYQQGTCQELCCMDHNGSFDPYYFCQGINLPPNTDWSGYTWYYDECVADCWGCPPLPSRKGGIVNSNSRFSGRSQTNPKGKPKK